MSGGVRILTLFITGAFGLIMLYLLFEQGGQPANAVLRGFGQSSSDIFRTLQGRG